MSKTSRLDSLDLLRGVAALLVLAGHARAYIFQSYFDLEQAGIQAGIAIRVFYFVTGLGHQAVMIFFALSGFLVGGKALDDILRQRFSWTRYLLRRLTRLWIVIVPTLLLTVLFDSIGLWLTSGTGYDGRYYELYLSGPRGPVDLDHSLLTLLGNLAFLQTIAVPTFGSNSPMWSLANEFWYYVVFPLAAWLSVARIGAIGRLTGLAVLLVLVVMLPTWLLEGGVIWVAGAAAAWCSRQPSLAGYLRSLPFRTAAVTLLVIPLVVSKIPAVGLGDLGLGIAVALALPVLAYLPSPGGTFTAIARASSEVSYTLYLTHFPLLTLIVMTGIAPAKWPPSIAAAVVYASLISVAIIWAAIVWWCFERNTDRAYSAIISKLVPRKAAAVAS